MDQIDHERGCVGQIGQSTIWDRVTSLGSNNVSASLIFTPVLQLRCGFFYFYFFWSLQVNFGFTGKERR
jgi:hypothetical protein